jgi:hypothetical protein
MKRKLAVIGTGSAGIQSLCHFLYWLPNGWEVTLIHDPKIPTQGIGESSNGSFPVTISLGLDFQLSDLEKIDGTHKFGTKYKNWRKNDFIGPLVVGTHAIHFNTHKFKEFAIPRFHEVWKDKFKEIQGNVSKILNEKDNVKLIIGEDVHTFEYVINSTGFPKDFTNYNTYDDHPVNHCLVHNIEGDYSSIPYTGHTATIDGWMFEVPLSTRMSYGYLFNNKMVSIEDAKRNFANQINVNVEELQNIEYNFKSYINKNIIDGRVMNGGNKSYFLEPLFANSLMTYNNIDRTFYDYIANKISEKDANLKCIKNCEHILSTIYFHYHGGSNLDTPFWNYAKTFKEKWINSELFQIIKQISEVNNKNGTEILKLNVGAYNWYNFKKFDSILEYDYFN